MNKLLCVFQEIWAFLSMAIFLFVVIGSAYIDISNSFHPSSFLELSLVGLLIFLLYSVWNMYNKDNILLNIYRVLFYLSVFSIVSFVTIGVYEKINTGVGLKPYDTIESLNLSLYFFIFSIIIPLFIFLVHNIYLLKIKLKDKYLTSHLT